MLQVVDVEAPEEARDEVYEDAGNVVAEPRLEEVGEWVPRTGGQQGGAEDEAVVEGGLVEEEVGGVRVRIPHSQEEDDGGGIGTRVDWGFRGGGVAEKS